MKLLKQYFFLLLSIFFIRCTNNHFAKSDLNNQKLWINQGSRFDTVYSPGSDIYSVMGSGTIIYLDSNNMFKSFTNTFYKDKDSISWGEPGVILTMGKWKIEEKYILAEHKLISKTFKLPTDTVGELFTDTFILRNESLVKNKGEKFIPVKILTTELRKFLERNWSLNKNSNR